MDELVRILRDAVRSAPEGEIVVSIHIFGIAYARDLQDVSLRELVRLAGIRPSYQTEIRKGMRLAEYVRIVSDLPRSDR
jgi:hypothetical protein